VSFGVRQIDVAIVDDPTCQRVLGSRASLRSVCWTSGGLMPRWLPGMENGWAPGQLDAVTAILAISRRQRRHVAMSEASDKFEGDACAAQSDLLQRGNQRAWHGVIARAAGNIAAHRFQSSSLTNAPHTPLPTARSPSSSRRRGRPSGALRPLWINADVRNSRPAHADRFPCRCVR
jgi:hypothetical protein